MGAETDVSHEFSINQLAYGNKFYEKPWSLPLQLYFSNIFGKNRYEKCGILNFCGIGIYTFSFIPEEEFFVGRKNFDKNFSYR